MAEKKETLNDPSEKKKPWEHESCRTQIIEALKRTMKQCNLSSCSSTVSSSSGEDDTMKDLDKDENLNSEKNGSSKNGDHESDVKKKKIFTKSDNTEEAQSSSSHTAEDELATWEYCLYNLFSGPTFLNSQYAVSTNPDGKKFKVFENCKALFEKDYFCYLIDNSEGVLSDSCPIELIVPVASRHADINREGLLKSKVEKYERMIKSCESQLVVPVILLDNKFICRSDPMSVKEAPSQMSSSASSLPGETTKLKTTRRVTRSTAAEALPKLEEKILNSLDIDWICDLMEKDGSMISESEKTNRAVYSFFKMNHMPYPGCGFFKSYFDKQWAYDGLKFQWDKEGIDTILRLFDTSHAKSLNIDIGDFKNWDIKDLTQNYMKILLSYIVQGTSGGLLVHCISDRDRTPLFISLLRISLWADKIIHKSLTATEMAYLTLGYDWHLFGHDIQDRFDREEEIMHFCFNFLPMLNSGEYSVAKMFHDMKPELKGDRHFPEFDEKLRTDRLSELRSLVLTHYSRWYVTIERVVVPKTPEK